MALRKIANLLKPDKEIVQDGDHMIIRTLSTFRNYIMDFQIGEEFEEDLTGIDDRKCMVRICTCQGISCPGDLTKGWASSSERRVRRTLCSEGLRSHPQLLGRQQGLTKHAPLSKPDGNSCESYGLLCLHCVWALSQVLYTADFT